MTKQKKEKQGRRTPRKCLLELDNRFEKPHFEKWRMVFIFVPEKANTCEL